MFISVLVGVFLLLRKLSSAYLLITCNEGKLNEVLIDVQKLDEVKESQETIGTYDIIAKIESATSEYLDKFLLVKIRTMPNIRSVMMLHCDKDLEL